MEKAVLDVLKGAGNSGLFNFAKLPTGGTVDGKVTVSGGIGGSLGLRSPWWTDADGYRWSGAVVGVKIGLPVQGGGQIGIKGDNVKLIIDAPGVTLELHIDP